MCTNLHESRKIERYKMISVCHIQTSRRVETESPHPFRPWVGTLESPRDPKGLGTQLQLMISRRSLNSEVSHGPGGVDLEPGTKPVGRSDLAHPLITDTDPS